jgi:hypothetical protein
MVKTSNLCPTFEATQTLGLELAGAAGGALVDLAAGGGACGFYGGEED